MIKEIKWLGLSTLVVLGTIGLVIGTQQAIEERSKT